MSPRNALPPRGSGIVRPMDRTLDSLTDTGASAPGTSGTRDTSGAFGDLDVGAVQRDRDIRGNADDSGTRGVTGTGDTRGTPDTTDSGSTRGTSGTRGTSEERRPMPRQHIKLRSDLADELRAAVWFLSERGRPRVQLGELLDEAVEAWLEEAKQRHNEGQAFPDRGRLR